MSTEGEKTVLVHLGEHHPSSLGGYERTTFMHKIEFPRCVDWKWGTDPSGRPSSLFASQIHTPKYILNTEVAMLYGQERFWLLLLLR